MIYVAILSGVVVWVLFSSIVAPLAYGEEGGLLPGFVAGCWVFWLFFLAAQIRRRNLCLPSPRSVRLPAPDAVDAIVSYLADSLVMYGEPWRRVVFVPEEGRLIYEMVWSDAVSQGQSGHYVKVHETTQYLRRQAILDIAVEEKAPGMTVVRLAWELAAEGSYDTCEHLARITTRDIYAALGPSMVVPFRRGALNAGPPWLLLGLTAIMLVVLGMNVSQSYNQLQDDDEEMVRTLTATRERLDQQVASTKWELAQWTRFKQARGIK